MLYVDFADIFRDISVDLVCLYFFGYLLIYRRLENRDLFVTCSVFNIALMLVVMTIVRTNFNLAVGFGLFALLSVVQVRSTPFTRLETAYFFAALALAVINGSGISDFIFVLVCNALIVGSAWTMSHWSSYKSESQLATAIPSKMKVLLDAVDSDATQNRDLMIVKLQRMYAVQIMSYSIVKIDYVKDTIELDILYLNTEHPQQNELVGRIYSEQTIGAKYE